MPASSLRRIALLALPFLLVATVGIFLRVTSFGPATADGFDEQIYAMYVKELGQNGTQHFSYPQVVQLYIKRQTPYPIALLPPTRVTFIFAAYAWRGVFGGPAVESVRAISCAASILVLLLSGVIAWRMRGRVFALGLLTLMTFAPTQIYMAHRALIDGFFTLITLLVLGSLWELIQESPPKKLWLAFYTITLALLVMTKENFAFVYMAILGLLIANWWLRLGRVSISILAATLAAPVLGGLTLAVIAGGIEPLITVFTLNAAKSITTPYAITTGDGPWFRYLSDLMLVSPAVMIFAIGGAFMLERTDKAGWYLLGFIVFSYAIMCNVTYGMNLRYANMWDFPLRYLALIPMFVWTKSWTGDGKRNFLLIGVVALLSLLELSNYVKIFVFNQVYDPIPSDLLKALNILK